IRSHASAYVNSQYGCCSRVSLGVAFSTCTCTRADVVPFCVARRISVSVSKFIGANLTHRTRPGACCSRRFVGDVPHVIGCPSARRFAQRSGYINSRSWQMYASIAPMFLKRVECTACGREHEWSRLQNLCVSCNKPLFAIVDLAAASRTLTRETLLGREKSLWRYREVLPLPSDVEPASLGEGGTPLLPASRAC